MAYTTINKSSEHMTASIWTGNGTKITTGFSPDWIWFKARNAVSYAGILNAITGYDKYVQSFSTDAETTSTGMMVTDSTGYTPGSVLSSNSYVGWSWKANGTGSANTDGSISSTVSANTTSGFSIVKYVGTGSGSNSTVGHGLGVTPSIILVKSLDSVTDWVVWHKDLPSQTNNYLRLNTNQAIGTTTNYWNSYAPTNQVFGVSPDGYNNNKSGEDTIAYCFSDVKGFSKMGSYTGNGSNDGSFCFTGMKPSFVMIKRTDSSASWLMFDNKRANPFNEITADLRADSSQAEDASTSYNNIDFLSNGFKIRKSNADINGYGATYIYMAFAEAPLVGTNNVPCTAR